MSCTKYRHALYLIVDSYSMLEKRNVIQGQGYLRFVHKKLADVCST